MTYLSVKALRHYHDVGLLEPAEIDPSSGYRHYTRRPGGDRPGDPPLPRPRHAASSRCARCSRRPTSPPATGRSSTTSRRCRSSSSARSTRWRRCRRCSPRRAAPRPVELPHPARHPGARHRRPTSPSTTPPTGSRRAYAELHAALDAAGLSPAGPDGALYHDAFFTEGDGDVVAFVPVGATPALDGRRRARAARAARHPGGGDGPRRALRRPRPDLRRPRHRGGRARPRRSRAHPRDLPGRRPRRGLLAHHPRRHAR